MFKTCNDIFEVLNATHQDFENTKDFGFAYYRDPSNDKPVFAVTREGEDEWTFDNAEECFFFLMGFNFGNWHQKD